jgi:putative addiction module killer protein
MEVFATDDYQSWINDLKDRAGRARVLMRVDRLIHGNPGLQRNLTEGLSELKIDVGAASSTARRRHQGYSE